ncbi:MAG: LemA family protein [Tannerellaceae bacterium]|jgi:LemA protein|nr:LemA family protein [Tannerellaceae bacterium]
MFTFVIVLLIQYEPEDVILHNYMRMIYIAVILGFLFIVVIYIYNKLVKNKNRMQEAWSMIDVFLKKRHDLIPNLVDIVKGYAIHEKTTLEKVTRYRSEAMQAGNRQTQISSEIGLAKSLNNLLVSVENYPQLAANEQFLKLQQQITDIENDLEMARRYYNGTVRENNICRESFPSNIIAGMFNFPKGVFFALEPADKTTPVISF